MNAGLIAVLAVIVLLGGLFMGIAAIFLVPLVGALGLAALLIWTLRRRADHKPPMP